MTTQLLSFTEEELELPVEEEVIPDETLDDGVIPDEEELAGPYNSPAAAAPAKATPSISARWQVKFSAPEKVVQTNTYMESFDLATLTTLLLGAKDLTTKEHMLQAYLNLGYAAFDVAKGQERADLQREIYAKVTRYTDLLMPLEGEAEVEIEEEQPPLIPTAQLAKMQSTLSTIEQVMNEQMAEARPLEAGDDVTWTVEVEGEEAYALEGTINSIEDSDGTGYAIVQPSLVDGEDTLRDPESHWLSELARVAAPQPVSEGEAEVEVDESATEVEAVKPAPTRSAAAVKTKDAGNLSDEPTETGKYTMQAALTIQPQPDKGPRMAVFSISSHDLPPVITFEEVGPAFWQGLAGKFATYQVELPNRLAEMKKTRSGGNGQLKFGDKGHLPTGKPTTETKTRPAPKPEPKPKKTPTRHKGGTQSAYDFG